MIRYFKMRNDSLLAAPNAGVVVVEQLFSARYLGLCLNWQTCLCISFPARHVVTC